MKRELTVRSKDLEDYLFRLVNEGKIIPTPVFKLYIQEPDLFEKLSELADATNNGAFIRQMQKHIRRSSRVQSTQPALNVINVPLVNQMPSECDPDSIKPVLIQRAHRSKKVTVKSAAEKKKKNVKRVPYVPVYRITRKQRELIANNETLQASKSPSKRVWIQILQGGAPGLGKRA